MLALANSENTKATLAAETDAARELGIFGSPTFKVGRELFWGDDRLADAISWCRFGRVQHVRSSYWRCQHPKLVNTSVDLISDGVDQFKPARKVTQIQDRYVWVMAVKQGYP